MRLTTIGIILSIGLLLYMRPPIPEFENLFEGKHFEYKIKQVGIIKTQENEPLIIEKAYKQVGRGLFQTVPYERIQIKNQSGQVVAHTPTRVKAIPICSAIESCYVYMWKTVYPMPALFKLNTDQKTWIAENKSPLKYSRKHYAGEGFTEETNLMSGLSGLLIFIFIHLWYYVLYATLTILLLKLLIRAPQVPENKKTYSMLLTTALGVISPIFMAFISRVLLMVIILIAVGRLAIAHFGIPTTHSLIIWLFTLFFSARSISNAQIRKDKYGVPKRKNAK